MSNFDKFYSLTELIGVGDFGQVHEAINLKANIKCAVKVMQKIKVCHDV